MEYCLTQGLVVSSCKHDHELLDSINVRKFLAHLSECQLPKQTLAPLIYVTEPEGLLPCSHEASNRPYFEEACACMCKTRCDIDLYMQGCINNLEIMLLSLQKFNQENLSVNVYRNNDHQNIGLYCSQIYIILHSSALYNIIH